MFKQLEALTDVLNLNVSIQKKGEHMTVLVSLISKDNDTDLNLIPIYMKGTSDEIDESFTEHLKLYTEKNMSRLERINFISESVKKAEKEVNDKATSKTSKSSKTKDKEAEEVEEEEPNLFASSEVVQMKSSSAKSKTASGKSTVTGSLTAHTMSEEEIEMIEASQSTPIAKEPEVEVKESPKVEVPKVDPATQAKDVDEQKKKLAGLPFVNRKGVLVNTDGTIYVAPNVEEPIEEAIVEEIEEAIIEEEVSFNEPEMESFNIDDFNLEPLDPKQELFDEICQIATDNHIQLNGFTIETQTIEKLNQLKIALNNRIKSR